jgi:hypothetical protein
MESDRMVCYVFPPFYIQLSEFDTETEQRGRFPYRRLQSVYTECQAERTGKKRPVRRNGQTFFDVLILLPILFYAWSM